MFNFTSKEHLVSALHTAVTVFILSVAGSLYATGHIDWNAEFWITIAGAGGRAVIKELFAQFAPTALGGVKK